MASKSRDLEEGPLSDNSQEEHKGTFKMTHVLNFERDAFSNDQRFNIDY